MMTSCPLQVAYHLIGLRSAASLNDLPQLGSWNLVEVHHLVMCFVLLQFLHVGSAPCPGLGGCYKKNERIEE